MSGCIPQLSCSHSPVFLLNSCLDLFSAPRIREDPLSRSYGVSLPSSLTMSLSTPKYALPDYLCRFAVRVPQGLLSGFSGEYDYPRSRPAPEGRPYSRLSARDAYFTAPLCTYCLQRAIPSARGGVTAPSPRRSMRQSRNVDREAIGCAARLSLRARLTPG